MYPEKYVDKFGECCYKTRLYVSTKYNCKYIDTVLVRWSSPSESQSPKHIKVPRKLNDGEMAVAYQEDQRNWKIDLIFLWIKESIGLDDMIQFKMAEDKAEVAETCPGYTLVTVTVGDT